MSSYAHSVPSDQPGLRMRMDHEARRISSQHRQLDRLYALVEDAVERGHAEEAHLAFQRFSDAIEAHTSLEDKLYFPALHGMHPDLEHELADLVREHRDFEKEFSKVAELLQTGDLARSREPLQALIDRIAAHERREEALMDRIRAVPIPGS